MLFDILVLKIDYLTAFLFLKIDHQYSPTAEFIPETFSYTGNSGPLDLSRYFIYAAAVIAVTYVRFYFCQR